ncbi:MAG: hypothetical protein KDB23_02450 [Planctomycetales bacterium]|nr:hypothetical protein [Planctomycetales bacterium]
MSDTHDHRHERDELILHTLCAYGGGYNELLSVAGWGKRGAPVGNVIRRMEQAGDVHVERRALDSRNWILPTERVCLRLKYPKHRASLPGGKALSDRVKFATFCNLAGARRWPIEATDLVSLNEGGIGPEGTDRRHVITTEFDGETPVVMSVVFSISSLREQIKRSTVGFAEMLAASDYGFFFLSETAQNDTKKVENLRQQAPRIVVHDAVTIPTLSAYLRRNK